MKTKLLCRRGVTAVLCVLFLLGILSGCGDAVPQETKTYATLSDFSGGDLGLPDSAVYEAITRAKVGDYTAHSFRDYAGGIEALMHGKIDAMIADRALAERAIAQHDDLTIFPETVSNGDYGFAFQKGSPLAQSASDVLADLKAEGILSALEKKWITDAGEAPVLDTAQFDQSGKNGVLRAGLYVEIEPLCYLDGSGRAVGYETELLYYVADRMGMRLEPMHLTADGMLSGIATGTLDVIAGSLLITDERRETMEFTTPTLTAGIVLLCRAESLSVDPLLNRASARIAVEVDGPAPDVVSAKYPLAELVYLNTESEGLLALKTGQVDAFAEQNTVYENALREGMTSIHLHSDGVVGEPGNVVAGISPRTAIPNAEQLVNTFLAKAKADGVIDDMYHRWVEEKNFTMPELPAVENPKYTVTVGTSGLAACYTFVQDGELTGFDVELARRFAGWLGAAIEFKTYDWAGLATACASGQVDYVFSNWYYTAERAEAATLSDPYLTFSTVLMVRDREATAARPSFWQRLGTSFEKTFIREQRWKMVISGLLTTLKITLCALALGTVLGILLYLLRRVRCGVLRWVVGAYCRLLSGLPAVLVLLILYFVVLASTSASPDLAAILGFSMLFSVSVTELFATGDATVDRGQREAALSLGMQRSRIFRRVVLPQVIRVVLPLYAGEAVATLKLTSIVGYISVQDLTKAGDIIRSRTYEAFFPLIAIAVIYFLLAWGLTALCAGWARRLDPHRRHSWLSRGLQEDGTAVPAADPSLPLGGELIRVEHLRKEYERITPLQDVNAVICRGDVISIIGPSGTGKSTLLRLINRLEEPTAGQIFLDGEDTTAAGYALSAMRRRVGMVFQGFHLFPHLTALENVMLAPVVEKRCSRAAAYAEAMRLLRTVGMAEQADSLPETLSGGQRQRVAIARALAMHPEVLLLDEPTSALDPTRVGEVQNVVQRLAESGITLLIVTHELQFARRVSTRIFYMDEGMVYEEGTPEQVMEHPKRNRTREFVQRLTTEALEIVSPDYDFIAMTETLRALGERFRLPPRQIENLVRCFEEGCALPRLVPSAGEEHALHVLAEYDEPNGTLSLQFVRRGEPYDPLADADETVLRLLRASAAAVTYAYADGKNTVSVTGIRAE